jgi:hypothetical protein
MDPLTLKLSEDVQSYFVPANLESTEEVSIFEGRYTLTIETYLTRPGCWEYTRGIIKAGNTILFEVQRNYSSFLHLEFLAHGHDFCIVGSSYMQPTLLDLTTRSIYPIDNDEFCWTGAHLSPSNRTLLIEGCYWGAPYEYKFYDLSVVFSDSPDQRILKRLPTQMDHEIHFLIEDGDWSVLIDCDCTFKWDQADTCIWTKKIKWFPDLKMDHDQAYHQLYQQFGLNNSDLDEKQQTHLFHQFYQTLTSLRCEMILTESVVLRRDGNIMVQVEHRKFDLPCAPSSDQAVVLAN